MLYIEFGQCNNSIFTHVYCDHYYCLIVYIINQLTSNNQ